MIEISHHRVENRMKVQKMQHCAVRLYLIAIIATGFTLSSMRLYFYSVISSMVIVEILKSYFLRLLISPIFLQDISNWMIKSVVFNGPYSILLSPRLQLVCLSKGLVGYWRGYFNHKRCRRRHIFKFRRYEFLYI